MKRKVIAVTGGIGSGKSTVCRLLEKKGFRVVDCDALSRRVAEQSETLEEIKRVFGKRFVADNSLDRRALARAFRRRVGGDGKRGNARQTGDDTRRQKRGADKEHH